MDMTIFLEQLSTILGAPDRKQAFFDLCDPYGQANAEQRDFLRTEWPFEREWFLPRARTLLLSDSYSSEQRLRAALIYESLEKGEVDFRDNLMSIAAIYHSALHLGLDPEQIFEEVAGLSGEAMADLLRGFYRRDVEDRRLEAFGYQEELTPDGLYIIYEDIPSEEWEPYDDHNRYGHVPLPGQEVEIPAWIKKLMPPPT